jgi:hypothetical protein
MGVGPNCGTPICGAPINIDAGGLKVAFVGM